MRQTHGEEYVRKQIAETEIEGMGTQDKEHRKHQMRGDKNKFLVESLKIVYLY